LGHYLPRRGQIGMSAFTPESGHAPTRLVRPLSEQNQA
jgi:hypothetical protein